MFKVLFIKSYYIIIILIFTVFVSACGGGASSSSSAGGGVPLTANGVTISFDVAGGVKFMSTENVLNATTSLSGIFSGDGPVLTEAKYWVPRAEGLMNGLAPLMGAVAGGGSSNFISVDANGAIKLALTGSAPVKASYSVIDPTGTYLYIALDADNSNETEFNFSKTIASLNCGLYKVRIKGEPIGETKCVSEGKLLPVIDDNYRQTVSGDTKPIQFDKDGNMYFAAIDFGRRCSPSCELYGWFGYPSMGWFGWNYWAWWKSTRVYKYDKDEKLTRISQDNESPTYFVVLPAGDVVFHSITSDGEQTGALSCSGCYGGPGAPISKLTMLRRTGQNIILSSKVGYWGQNFFTTDTNDAVIWASYAPFGGGENGINFARPDPTTDNGSNWAMLKTSLFADPNNNNGYDSPTPRRLIVGDDGKLYGIFQGYRYYYDVDPVSGRQNWKNESSLKVQQILPYDPVPKVVVKTSNDAYGWWAWMKTTPFIISNGYIYYKDSVDKGDLFGLRDVIKMVRITDRKTTTILEDNVFQIYNWTLSDGKLIFSGLKSSTNKVVIGKIDTQKLAEGKPIDEYLELQYPASASGAAASIKDITIVRAPMPPDLGVSPSLTSFNADPENLYSLSLSFNNNMDMEDAYSKIKLRKHVDSSILAYFPVWIYKSMHLIPVGAGLSYSTRKQDAALSFDTSYRVEIPNSVKDRAGAQIAAVSDKQFKTRPLSGWYSSTASLAKASANDPDIDGDDNIARWAQAKDASGYWVSSGTSQSHYQISDSVPESFRFEFSARNRNSSGLTVYLWDSNVSLGMSRRILNLDLGNWTNLSVMANNSSYRDIYLYGVTNNLFTGEWLKYRIDMWGSNLKLSYCKEKCIDATSWLPLSTFDISNIISRSSFTPPFKLSIALVQSMDMGSFKIIGLDAAASEPQETGVAILAEELSVVPTWLTSKSTSYPQW